MGSLTVTFYLQRYAPGEDSSGSHLKLQLGLGIGLGLAGLAICLLIIILIFKWRRQKEANESGHSIMSPDETLEHTDNRPRSTTECEGAYDAIHLDETAMRASYLALRVPTTSRQEERKSNEYELPVNNDSSKTTSSPQIHTYSNL